MQKKDINKNRLIINAENKYENNYKLMKLISKAKKGKKHSNYSLTERKKELKDLMLKINDEYELNENGKSLRLNNENFHNEYKLFNKRKNKEDTKLIFKDLIKLYKLRGYRIPNFSINEHNIFKINPLLETNSTTISNGILAEQILKKTDDSEKIMNYLKKLGGILSEKLANDDLKKNFKKIKVVKLKYYNEEDSVENLKKQIEILTNLINTNALDKLDEPKKTNYGSYSRKSSLNSNKYKSNKKLIYLNKQKISLSRKNSKMLNQNEIQMYERRISTESSMTSRSNLKQKEIYFGKSSQNICKIFNYNSNIPPKYESKTPKDIKIPTLNLQKINQKNEENIIEQNDFKTPTKPKFVSEKFNNIFINELKKTPRKKILNWTRKSIKDIKTNLIPSPLKLKNQRHLSTFKNYYFNNDSSLSEEKENLEHMYQTTTKKKHQYTNKNDFINYIYHKFSKKGINNCENYIKTYLNKVKGFNEDKAENFVKAIYDKNIKNNLKDLENQITDNDIYYRTERLYLSNHLIKRISSKLKNMNEKDKIILKLEKNFTHALLNK